MILGGNSDGDDASQTDEDEGEDEGQDEDGDEGDEGGEGASTNACAGGGDLDDDGVGSERGESECEKEHDPEIEVKELACKEEPCEEEPATLPYEAFCFAVSCAICAWALVFAHAWLHVWGPVLGQVRDATVPPVRPTRSHTSPRPSQALSMARALAMN